MDSEPSKIPPKDTPEASLIRTLRRNGYTEQKITSYLRGWRIAGKKRSNT